MKLILERVYVLDDKVVAMTLRSNYHLVLNHKTNEPTEFSVDPLCVTNGSDGLGTLSGCSCEIWTSGTEKYHLLIHKLLTDGLNQIATS